MSPTHYLALLLALLVLAAPASAAPPDPPPITEVLVGLPAGTSSLQVTALGGAIAAGAGLHAAGTLHYRPVVRVALDGRDLDTTLAELRADPRVAYAEPNYPVYADAAPLDPALYTYQWGFRRAGGPAALGRIRALGHPDLTLAIVDTGTDDRHPDLAGRVDRGHDFVDGDNLPLDENGHGTHTASIAGAATFNDLGIAAPFPGRIMAVRVLNGVGIGTVGQVADGIDYAARNGARVINLSLGYTAISETLHQAIRDAEATGVVLVAAAGNSGNRTRHYPAAFDEVIAVSAWGFRETLTDFSSHYPGVELTAPGEQIYAAYLHGGYQLLSGTSMASPLVAGTAAAVYAELLALDPGLPLVDAGRCVRRILDESAEDLFATGRDEYTGFGMVRIDRALELTETIQCVP